MFNLKDAPSRLRLHYQAWKDRRNLARLAYQVKVHARTSAPNTDKNDPQTSAPVVLFNASTRISGLSLNAAFQLLTAWALRLAGVPVIHFVCQEGLKPCVLGTNRQDHSAPPPCADCMAQSHRLYAGAEIRSWPYAPDPVLAVSMLKLDVEGLSNLEYPLRHPVNPSLPPMPLGRLVLPSIRWALRRHSLPDDEPTRYLFRQYIFSAYSLAQGFAALLDEVKPQTVVIFNGIMYPEATARWVARQMGVRSVAHEVGFQQFSTFFTEGEPTAYPIEIPSQFELNEQQNARLDAYLEQRFQGKFTMAGIRFWPEMRGLDEALLHKISQFHQVVPVFTNVVYDTSQVHANVVFPHMFAWLEVISQIIQAHPETLFVLRAHPDEMRPGTAKQSNESVHDWVMSRGMHHWANVVFIDSRQYVSSYELIQRSKFVMVYNSSIGLEATLMGRAVLCGGRARYTQYPMVFFPQSPEAFRRQAEEFLKAEAIDIPPEFQRNARRFLYYQLYRASLPMDRYLQSAQRPGFVRLREFSWEELLPQNSPTIRVLLNGILRGEPFLMPEDLSGKA